MKKKNDKKWQLRWRIQKNEANCIKIIFTLQKSDAWSHLFSANQIKIKNDFSKRKVSTISIIETFYFYSSFVLTFISASAIAPSQIM